MGEEKVWAPYDRGACTSTQRGTLVSSSEWFLPAFAKRRERGGGGRHSVVIGLSDLVQTEVTVRLLVSTEAEALKGEDHEIELKYFSENK